MRHNNNLEAEGRRRKKCLEVAKLFNSDFTDILPASWLEEGTGLVDRITLSLPLSRLLPQMADHCFTARVRRTPG